MFSNLFELLEIKRLLFLYMCYICINYGNRIQLFVHIRLYDMRKVLNPMPFRDKIEEIVTVY